MTTNQIILNVVSIVATLGETTKPGESVPASSIYMALGSDYPAYWATVQAGERSGLLKITPERITLTELGREKAVEFTALSLQD